MERQGRTRQPPRPRLCVRTILQHGVGDGPGRQPAARRHQARRSAADELFAALQGTGAGPRPRLLAGREDLGGRVDRIERRVVDRHRHQHGQTHDLCRAQSARGVLHAKRQGGVGHGPRRGLYRRARPHDVQGDGAHQDARWSGHDDLLSRWPVRLCLFVVQSGAGRVRCRDPRAGRTGGTAKPVLSQYCRDAGRQAGVVHAEGHRQDGRIRCETTLRDPEGAGYRADHQPCQLRPHGQGAVRLCDGRRRECGEGVPHIRLRARRHHPGRQDAARCLAIGRRPAHLRRAGECR